MEHLSRALANKVGGALHYPPEQIEVLAYGFFGLLQTAFLLAGTALLGWAIGAFWPCLAAVLAGSLLRRFAGGAHASTPGRRCWRHIWPAVRSAWRWWGPAPRSTAPTSRCSVKSAAKGCGGAH